MLIKMIEKSNGLFDIHAHYTDERFEKEYPGGVNALLRELFDSGNVGYIIDAATNLDDADRIISMARDFKGMYVAAGIHPSDIEVSELAPDEQLRALDKLLRRSKENKIKAVGEIGLDYYWEPVLKEKQKYFFEGQIELALMHGLPVVIHDREAHGDCFDTVGRYPGLTGVFHCYSGSAEMAKELVKKGWYLSFGGTVTFKNARRSVESVDCTPTDRLLLETDCPYLAPVPYRGKLNHSGLAVRTAEKLAEIKGVSTDDIIRITRENACRLFGI